MLWIVILLITAFPSLRRNHGHSKGAGDPKDAVKIVFHFRIEHLLELHLCLQKTVEKSMKSELVIVSWLAGKK
jgi:hypothetical protein